MSPDICALPTSLLTCAYLRLNRVPARAQTGDGQATRGHVPGDTTPYDPAEVTSQPGTARPQSGVAPGRGAVPGQTTIPR